MNPLLPLFARFSIFSAILFAARAVLVKSNALDISPANLLMWQGLMAVPLLWLVTKSKALSVRPNLKLWRLYSGRIGFGLANLVLLFVAITHLPTTIASTLGFTAPIFVALLTPAVMGETTTRPILAGILLGFIGVVVSAAPHVTEAKSWYLAAGVGAGLCGALMHLCARKLAKNGEPGLRTVFWLNAAAGVTGLVWSVADGLEALSLHQMSLAFCVALFGVFGQVLLVSAFKRGPSVVVNGMTFLRLPLSTLMAYVFLHETTAPLTLVGVAITVGACIYLLKAEQRRLRLEHDQALELTKADIREERVQAQEGAGALDEPLFVPEPTDEEVEVEQYSRPLQHDPREEALACRERLAA